MRAELAKKSINKIDGIHFFNVMGHSVVDDLIF